MGLLKINERQQLISLLLKHPNRTNPVARRHIFVGLPLDLQNSIGDDPAPKTHFQSIVDAADDEAWDEPPYGGTWPVLQLIDNAIFQIGPTSSAGQQLNFMLNDLKSRADLWRSLDPLKDKPPQDPDEFERVMNERLGFHDPEEWSAFMRQATLAVCLIEFENVYPKVQGTGFLVGPSAMITNYHVMEPVFKNSVKPGEVVLRFNYRTGTEGTEYRLASDWRLDTSPENELDYTVLRVNGFPGNDRVESLPGKPQRKWFTPQAYIFQAGEPLTIIQHPTGKGVQFAIDCIKTLYPNRVSYRTNTDHGSSGSPCFTFGWQLVALHQGTLSKDVDPDKPNKGIPFTPILKQPEVRKALGT